MRFDDDDEDIKPGDKKKKPRERARGMEEPSFDAPTPSFNERGSRRDYGGSGFGGGFGDRPPRSFKDRPLGGGGFGDRPARPFNDRPQIGGFSERPPRQFNDRPQSGGGFGDRPSRPFNDRPPRQYGDRPKGGNSGFGDRLPRRDFGGGGGGDRGPRNFEDRAPREPLENHEGTVKFFNGERGFGFITPDGGGADVFVHISAVQRSGFEALEPDQRIAFQTLPDRFGKGPKAINLSLLDGPSPGGTARPAAAPGSESDDQPDMGDYDPE
ncbi:cold-shock protein [Candidatus Phycosocius spiralis]|uniref:CSD domain-containing protein n=1 Tax=Candidatus Phycosocius spiralis TaxID=2815099 RepID=A0ABQ4PTF5_9PROT|nr:cold-shock protein [Candidatus Phycosocius spiralis]GIU66215.1 hypothetical protein PsB1_0369 [Candidatus Phycosocius spiralis]